MPTTTLTKPNAYAATCVRCHARVAAGAGLLARTDTGWAADHIGDCPPATVAVATPVRRVTRDGIYRTEAGAVYKVQHARGGGRLYAKLLTVTACTDGAACGHPTITDTDGVHHHGHFAYAAGAIHQLRDDQALPKAEAVAFGQLYGVCIACGADLTDETSIARGIGPVCGGRW